MDENGKRLLAKEICARLPYGLLADVRFHGEADEWVNEFPVVGFRNGTVTIETDESDVEVPLEDVAPLLIPIDSLTDEERKELYHIRFELGHNASYIDEAAAEIDWYNEHHVDYRDLIGKGLAMKADSSTYGKAHKASDGLSIDRFDRFMKIYCDNCGSQRCCGIFDKEWREGCDAFKREFTEAEYPSSLTHERYVKVAVKVQSWCVVNDVLEYDTESGSFYIPNRYQVGSYVIAWRYLDSDEWHIL